MATELELKAKIEAQGELVRKLKGDKSSAPEVIKKEVANLLAIKEEYKKITGQDYTPPNQTSAKKEKKETVQGQEATRDKPSKKDLKKMAKKEKKAESKTQSGQALKNAGGGLNGDARTSSASASSTTVLLYPGNDISETHTILAVAHAGRVTLGRGFGSDPSFFGSGPHLKLPDGQVISGFQGIVRALALIYAPSLDPVRPGVDDLLEWGVSRLSVSVSSEDASSLIKDLSTLESAIEASSSPSSAVGGGDTLADYVLAPLAKKALTFFAENEYPHVRKWVQQILEKQESFKSTASLIAAKGGPFSEEDTEEDAANVDPRQGLLALAKALFTVGIRKAYPELIHDPNFGFRGADVARCANANHGDYQCNNPMGIYRYLKTTGAAPSALKPQDVAKIIIDKLPPQALEEVFSDVTVAGAGFINVRFQDSYLKARIRDVLAHGPQAMPAKKLKVLVDFSSPNIAKEMHVGHLRSTIIGDSICRMLEFLGHDVLRINHVGDWGTQFGMLINYLKEEYPDFMSNPPNITDLTTFYKNAKQRFDESAEFKDRARIGVVELQSGNPESRAIWNLLCDISRKEFQKVYDRLNVRLEEYGESYYNEMIPGAIQELDSQGLLTIDDGATLMWCGGKHQIPLIVRKSDGGYGYDSTDLAAVRYRLSDLDRDWIIYITDAGQAGHFHLIFDAARLAGWVDPPRHRLDHVGFGVVQGEDGKRFKTRSGETVRLVDLLDEAVQRMTATLADRIKEGKSTLTDDEAKRASAILGYGAVKYADLKQNPTSDYQFSYDRMLDTRGDTAIYLLFTYARLCSILSKAEQEKGIKVKELIDEGNIVLEEPAERALALELAQFAESLESAVMELMPNRICGYLYNLSGKCTDFLETCHVLTTPYRLLLVQATALTIARCLEILGITPLERL